MRTTDPAFARIIAESAPDGLLVADAGGRIVVVNAEVERLFGYGREELVGQPLELLVPDRYRGSHIQHVQTYGWHPTRREMGSGLDLWGLRKDGVEFPVEISLSPVATEEGAVVIAAVRDISDRRRLEQDHRRSEERYRMLAEHAQDMIFRIRLVPPPARIEYMSPAVTPLTGFSPEDHYANPSLFFSEVAPEDRHWVEQLVSEPSSVPTPLLLRVLRRDGALVWHEMNWTVVTDEAERRIAIEGTARDVSERIAAEDERRELLMDADRIADRERIARDLHDGTMQAMYAAGLNLQALATQLPIEMSEPQSTIADTVALLRDAIADMRRYVMDLRFSDAGQPLTMRIAELAGELRAERDLAVHLELTEQTPELTAAQVETLLHIVREALSNVRRHAHARELRLVMTADDRDLLLLIEDDGDGFDALAALGSAHMGLRNMQARAEEIGAELSWETAPSRGTRLRCSLTV